MTSAVPMGSRHLLQNIPAVYTMSSVLPTLVPLANYATGLGIYDASIVSIANAATTEIGSAVLGSGDISFNAGYVINPNTYVMPPAVTGNGISFSGWFWPTSSGGGGYLLNIVTSGTPIVVTVASGNVSATYNGTTVVSTDPSRVVVPQAWNFYCFTVECSGGTAALSLHVNGGLYSGVAVGTYAAQTWTSSYLGAGVGGTANQFVGKMDDVRSFMRALRPMEVGVLYGYAAAAKIGQALPLVPSLTTLGYTSQYTSSGTIGSNTIAIASNSVFSYLAVQRTPPFAGGYGTKYVSAAAIQRTSGGGWGWTDACYNSSSPFVYSLVPYALGAPASSGTTIASPAVISNVVANAMAYSISFTLQGSYKTLKIYRNTTGQNQSATLIQSGITSTSWTDSTTSAATTYYYNFVPFNAAGIAGNSFWVTSTTLSTIRVLLIPSNAGSVGGAPYYSNDGLYWVKGNGTFSDRFWNIVWGSNICPGGIAGWVGGVVGGYAYYSTDGLNWTQVPTPTNYIINSPVGSDGNSIVLSAYWKRYYYNGNYSSYTPFAVTTLIPNSGGKTTSMSSDNTFNICYGNGTFLALGSYMINGYSPIFISTDGIHWTPSNSTGSSRFFWAIYVNNFRQSGVNCWIASSQSQTTANNNTASNVIWKSLDNGMTWTGLYYPGSDTGGHYFYQIATDGGGMNFCFASDSVGILYTTDGFQNVNFATMYYGATKTGGRNTTVQWHFSTISSGYVNVSCVLYAGMTTATQDIVNILAGTSCAVTLGQSISVWSAAISGTLTFSVDNGASWFYSPSVVDQTASVSCTQFTAGTTIGIYGCSNIVPA